MNSLCFSFCAKCLSELFIAEMNCLIVEYAIAIPDILYDPLEFSSFEESLHVLCIFSESLILWFQGVEVTKVT